MRGLGDALKGCKKWTVTEYPEWVFLSYGVPPEWMAEVQAKTEETLFDLTEHLPREAAEALLDLATGIPICRRSEARCANVARSSHNGNDRTRLGNKCKIDHLP